MEGGREGGGGGVGVVDGGRGQMMGAAGSGCVLCHAQPRQWYLLSLLPMFSKAT
jgi:hypothetical protein